MTAKREPVSIIQFCGSNDAFCGRPILAFDYLISYGENRDAWIQYDGCGFDGKKGHLPATEDSAVHGWPIPLGGDAGSGIFNPAGVISEFFEKHPKR